MQHLITLSKKGSIADDKDVSNGDASQQISTYITRVSTLFMFGLHGVQISSRRLTILNEMLLLSPSAARVAFRGSNGPNVSYEKTLL
jgi:hypothetical protein